MPQEGVTYRELVRLALSLPGVEQGTSYGTPALRVKRKLLLRLKEDGETVALHVPMEAREVLLRSDSDVFFLTDHYRNDPMVLVRLAAIDRDRLADLLEMAWRERATKRMVEGFDASRGKD